MLTSTLTSIGGVVVTVAVIAAVAVLAWHGSINGEAAVGILGGIVGGGIAGVSQHTGVKLGAKVSKDS